MIFVEQVCGCRKLRLRHRSELGTGLAVAIIATSLPVFPVHTWAQSATAETERTHTLGATDGTGRSTLEIGKSSRLPVERDFDLQRQINDLRSNLLDEREKRIGREQQAPSAVLFIVGIAIGIGGLWAFAKFRAIAGRAGKGAPGTRDQVSFLGTPATSAKALPGPPGQDLQEISVFVPEESDAGPGTLLRTAGSVRASPVAGPLEDAICRALSTCEGGEAADPAERWRVLALIAARKDSDLTARPWLASGNPPNPAPGRDALPNSGPAIRPDPDERPNGGGEADAEEDLLRYEEAIADCTDAIRSDPDDPRLYLERADAQSGLGRVVTAIADYDRAIRLDPSNPEAYLGRCHAKADLGMHKEALDDYDQAVGLSPDLAAEAGYE